jgi:hypothetical protein
MPFPKVTYCIICEGVRPELGGKVSILGFFGVAPNVDIGLAKFDQPLSLAVVIGFGPVTDANQVYNHSVVVLNPDGSILFQTPTAKINTVPGKGGAIVAGAVAIPRTPGLRIVRVLVNGETWSECQFMIRQATPQELAGLPGAAVH